MLLPAADDREFRRSHRDFSRGGPLSPALLTTLLLYMVADGNRRGYKLLLDGFWDEAHSFGLSLPTESALSGPSFCTARQKISPDYLRGMLHKLARKAFDGTFGSSQRWYGRRVFAVDGTNINVQRTPELTAAFGVPTYGYCPQLLVSVLLDVCAKMPVDVEVSPTASNERDHVFRMLPKLEPGDVLVLDRGYPSHKILQALALANVDFLMRMPSTETFAAIGALRASDLNDAVFTVNPPEGAPADWRPLRVRAVRLWAPDGSETFYFTSLSRTQFRRSQLRDLYHKRWQAEEFYKLLKGPYIGQGQLRSKSADGVVQEIHALVLFLALSRLLMAVAAKAADTDYASLSQKAAALALATYLVRLLVPRDQSSAIVDLRALLRRIASARQKPRPGRSYPRRSFRPRPRWGPDGRIGR